MPIDLLKYSDIIKQELASGTRDPSNVLLAWVLAWAFSEPNELLARQITRQLKIEAPSQFQQAFGQLLQFLDDPNFKQKAIRAFEMAIHRYKVRESIKALAFEGPTSQVLIGLKEIQQYLPHVNVLSRLIQDVEAILQYRGEQLPQQVEHHQQITQQVVQQPPPLPQINQAQQSTPPIQATSIPSQQYATPQLPSTHSSASPQPTFSPGTAQSVSSGKISEQLNTLESRLDVLEDLVANIDEVSEKIKLLEEKFSTLAENIREELEIFQGFLDKFKQEIISSIREVIKEELGESKTTQLNLDPEVLSSLKKAMNILGVKLNKEIIERLLATQKALAPRKKGPRPPPGPPPEVPLSLPPTNIAKQEEKPSNTLLPPPPPLPQIPAIPLGTPKERPSVSVPTMETSVGGSEDKQLVVSSPSKRELLLTAYGGLRKLTAILKDYRIGTFRWQFNVSSTKGNFVVIIQGAERRLPRRIQEEIVNNSEGLLVVEDIMESNIPKLVKFIRLMSKLRFIIWGGVLVPQDIENLGIPVLKASAETLEDLINAIAKAIEEFY